MFKVGAKRRIRQQGKRNRLSKLETLERRQLLAAEIPNFVGDGQIGVVGTVQVSNTWATVNLTQTFVNPVVIAGPASRQGADPLSVRVRDVDSDSFQIALDEWDYLDGGHSAESVSYLVVEGGIHTLTNGSKLVAGYLNNQTNVWTSFSTDDVFNSQPVLLSQIMTENDSAGATTRTKVTTNNDFEIRIQEEEAADGTHGSETVGFIAIDTAVASTGGQTFESFVTAGGVTDSSTAFSFTADFDATPAFFANMQTFNGSDASTVRRSALSSNSASFFIEEEASGDSEVAHNSGERVGGLVIEAGGIFATLEVTASDRFDALEQHILGNDTMTFAEFKTWSNTFDSESGALGDRVDDVLAAAQVVELYESNVGPLFTSQGVSSFLNAWPSSSDNRGLERSIFRVYQSAFDAVDAELIANHPDVIDGLMFRSTENFPGTVPSPTDPTAVYQVSIDGTLEEQFGSPGGYDTNAARRMTGAYLAPGSVAEVIVPQALVNAGFTIRVGGHSWDLSNKNTANRLHRVSNLFDITSTVTQVANPMGGNIYIEVPIGADAGIVDVQFRNTIRAPFFSDRSFDKTSQGEWENTERNHPGVFTDIESEHTMWTVPSKWVRTFGYATMMEMIEAHDEVIQTVSVYSGKTDRHKAVLYMIVDTQIRGNAFSIGYPQSNYGSFASNSRQDPLTIDHAYDRVLLHEHGHAEYFSMFSGETESIHHMLATAVGDKLEGLTLQQAFGQSLAYGSHNHTTSDTLSSWVVMDEFLAGQDMAYQQGSYRPRGHADYTEYVELFGWEAIENFNRTINEELDGLEWTDFSSNRTSHNKNDRILRLSREAGVNVAPLFHLWGHSPSNQSSLANAMQAEGLGPSVGIYDRMIEARNSVPQTQAEWNTVKDRMSDFLNNDRGPWVELSSGYVSSAYNGNLRKDAAVNRIDALISLYFPNGRPEVVDRNQTLDVVLYDRENFHGQTLQLTEGRYGNVDLDASLIGNNGTSSISIPHGYEVTAYNFQFSSDRATYAASAADLGTMNNRTSSLVISRTTIDGLSVDIGGTAAGTQYDQLITNAGTVDGTLAVSLTDSFVPTSAHTFNIVDSTTVLAGEFDNVESGQRMETIGGEGFFLVTYVDDMVVLSDFETTYDFGDAPATYAGAGFPTLRANDGARHAAVGPQLGPIRDTENDGAPNIAANGDAGDDGVLFGGIGVTSTVAAVNIELAGVSEGRVDAWIDFNRDGVWGTDEKIIDNALVNQSMQTINYDLPAGLTTGDNYARVRLSSAGGLNPNGFASDGEVEDYIVSVANSPTVESIVINGGDAQRSSVDSVQINFDQVIDIDSTGGVPFSLVHDSGDVVTAFPAIDHSSGKTVVNLTFDPSGLRVTPFGSLQDGNYQLTIDAERVHRLGVELDGNGDGSAGGDYVSSAVDGLFRKYGDHSGDGTVGLADFAAFRQTFGRTLGDDNYLDGLDTDGNNNIGLTDFASFRSNFGT